jgi:hypothetical protein
VFASDEVIFAWAIGKAMLIVIVSLGILVYAAWLGTKEKPRKTRPQRFLRVSDLPLEGRMLGETGTVFRSGDYDENLADNTAPCESSLAKVR